MLRNLTKSQEVEKYKYKYKYNCKINYNCKYNCITIKNPNKLTLFRTMFNTIGLTSYLGFLSVNKYNLT